MVAILFSLFGCTSHISNKEIAADYLIENGYVADHTIDNELIDVINGVNILAKLYLNKEFVTEVNYIQKI